MTTKQAKNILLAKTDPIIFGSDLKTEVRDFGLNLLAVSPEIHNFGAKFINEIY